jgi:hypothetical protein
MAHVPPDPPPYPFANPGAVVRNNEPQLSSGSFGGTLELDGHLSGTEG